MKNQMLNIVAKLKFGLLVLALVVLGLGGLARIGSAQTGSGSPPPTYDYNDTVPGVQGPTSPLMAGAERRILRPFQVTIPVLVPLTELQALLPPGFNAIATPAGSNTGQVNLLFIFQQRSTRTDNGQTVGPASAFGSQTSAVNTNLMPNRQETVLLGIDFSNQEHVDATNADYGPGASRLADVNAQLTEDDKGNLTFKFDVTEDGIGLNVSAQATCPGPIVNRVKTDPGANPLRYLIPDRPFFTAAQSDQRVVPQAMTNVKVETPDGKLHVPVAAGSGSLTISSIGASITFYRNFEVFIKYE